MCLVNQLYEIEHFSPRISTNTKIQIMKEVICSYKLQKDEEQNLEYHLLFSVIDGTTTFNEQLQKLGQDKFLIESKILSLGSTITWREDIKYLDQKIQELYHGKI
jgi:hypothetical protein